MEKLQLWRRKQTQGEEIANSVSHAVGFLAAVVITPVLIMNSIPSGIISILGACIFGSSMIILYLASTLYHAFPHGRAKQIFRSLDHSAIFLLIAGTYTPITLSVFPGAWGWGLFGMIWCLAVLGMVVKAFTGSGNSKLSIALYLGMGWLAILVAKPMYESMPAWGLFWLLCGGVIYTTGVLFFVYDHRLRYNHFIWHLFVLAGTACHVLVVLRYIT
jgi:hemolysin III